MDSLQLYEIRRENARRVIGEMFRGNQSAFARHIGREANYISRVLKGSKNLGEDLALEVEQKCGLPRRWMDEPHAEGLGDLLKRRLSEKRAEREASNVTDGPPLRGRVPLISWTSAGSWAEVEDLHPVGLGYETILTTANVGPHAFALRVQGDSMEPRVPDGSIVIIDPDRGHHHGSIVLAKRTSDQQATLKQLWYDGATPKLRPLNERYDILDMPPDTRIIGVAVKLELDL